MVDAVPREALQPSCPTEPKKRRGTDTDHGSWTTSAYRVVDEVRDGILATLDAGKPTVDAFASPVNARFPKFWTRDDDAFQKDWGKEGLLWVNPPFEKFSKGGFIQSSPSFPQSCSNASSWPVQYLGNRAFTGDAKASTVGVPASRVATMPSRTSSTTR